MAIGILAYGSLIEDPGVEIEPLIQKRINNVTTPFKIEFARSSSTRGGAPTVVPVVEGGSTVSATILVLNEETTIEMAKDLLWRRETRKEGSDKHYIHPKTHSPNKMVVEQIADFSGLDTVLYTKLGKNIDNLCSERLATLAINSAKSNDVDIGKDGISYLIDTKKQEITTPLAEGYEKAILSSLSVESLNEALDVCREKK
jgi:cation transport regulator ChaC